MSKITEHPTAKFIRRIEEQEKLIRDMAIDVLVLRDLLARTIRMLARLENQGLLPVAEVKRPKGRKLGLVE